MQGRRFTFFEKDVVKDPETGKPLAAFQVQCSSSERCADALCPIIRTCIATTALCPVLLTIGAAAS